MSDSKAPTLSDVARDAGVSIYTASVVLNGSRSNTRVSEGTRKRILETAATLRYYPNAMARGLVRRRMNTLGVLFGVIETSVVIANPYASTILQGILTAAADTGYCVTIFTESWKDAASSANRFRDGRTDGILVIAPPSSADILEGLSSLGLALSVIAASGEFYGAPSVDVDNAYGVCTALDHLLSLGHRRIAHLTGNPDMVSAQERREAFCAALNAARLPARADQILTCRYDGVGVADIVRTLLAQPDPPTAILAGNDRIALVALDVAYELGICVPDQLSLIGFDDIPEASLRTPPLTTVRQPLLQIGEKAARLLVARIEGEKVPAVPHLLEPQLIVRGTTAPATK